MCSNSNLLEPLEKGLHVFLFLSHALPLQENKITRYQTQIRLSICCFPNAVAVQWHKDSMPNTGSTQLINEKNKFKIIFKYNFNMFKIYIVQIYIHIYEIFRLHEVVCLFCVSCFIARYVAWQTFEKGFYFSPLGMNNQWNISPIPVDYNSPYFFQRYNLWKPGLVM